MCFYINERWSTDVTVLKKMYCSDLETLFINCKPFYYGSRVACKPRKFCSFILVSVNIPRSAFRLSDHCLVNHIPTYMHKLKSAKPVVKTVKR